MLEVVFRNQLGMNLVYETFYYTSNFEKMESFAE